jgi:hypothetical protein
MRSTLNRYDGIAFLLSISNRNARVLQDSREELDDILSDPAISKPIVIFVPSENASGHGNDPETISEFWLDDVIREGKGRVSVFAYSLSPNKFVGCLEGQLLKHILSPEFDC